MKDRIRYLLILLAAFLFAAGFFGMSIRGIEFQDTAAAQGRDQFRHSTAAHRKNDCNSCHSMPTANWARARGFPDVAEFPGHASCIGCHRRDFFMGNRPTICAGCHVNPGPRGAARFPFPVTSRSTEFSTIFPHDTHQDIIAKAFGPKDVGVGHFIAASFTPAGRFDDDQKPQFNNCAICHKVAEKLPKTAPRIDQGLTPLADAAADDFLPKAEFFKDSPSGHASCFQCHFQGLKPSAINCAGCHKLEAPYFDKDITLRYSLKFDHSSTNHANKDCTTCHVRITQNADLKTMKDADVPILACSTSSCHGSNISTEIGKREASIAAKAPAFQCNYCHTTAVGRFPVPQSHKDQ